MIWFLKNKKKTFLVQKQFGQIHKKRIKILTILKKIHLNKIKQMKP